MNKEAREKAFAKFKELRARDEALARKLGLPVTAFRFSLKRLKNIRLRIDKENFLRYYALQQARGERRPKRAYALIKTAQRVLRGGSNYVTVPVIMRCAEELRVPPELLVDEEYYFSRFGFAGYRILLEAYKRGVSIEELTFCDGSSNSDDGRVVCNWYQCWYYIISSRFDVGMNPAAFSRVMRLCRERLGIDIGDLVREPARRRRQGDGLMGSLAELLSVFDEYDCAFVVGAARALHDYKYGADRALKKNLGELVDWYCAKEKERGVPEYSRDVCGKGTFELRGAAALRAAGAFDPWERHRQLRGGACGEGN